MKGYRKLLPAALAVLLSVLIVGCGLAIARLS